MKRLGLVLLGTIGALVLSAQVAGITGFPSAGFSQAAADLLYWPLAGGPITVAADMDVTLSGGVNGFSLDGDTFSVDATNNRVGVGTAAPGALFTVGSDAFRVESTGRTTIGPAPPDYLLQATFNGSGNGLSVMASENTTAASRGVAYVGRTRGTSAAPTAILSGDTLGDIGFHSVYGSGYAFLNPGAFIRATATENWAVNSTGTKLEISTTLNGNGFPGTAMTIDQSQFVGIGDTSPAAMFTVGDGDDFQVSSTGAVSTTAQIKSTLTPSAAGGFTTASAFDTAPIHGLAAASAVYTPLLSLRDTGATNSGIAVVSSYDNTRSPYLVANNGSGSAQMYSSGNTWQMTSAAAVIASFASAGAQINSALDIRGSVTNGGASNGGAVHVADALTVTGNTTVPGSLFSSTTGLAFWMTGGYNPLTLGTTTVTTNNGGTNDVASIFKSGSVAHAPTCTDVVGAGAGALTLNPTSSTVIINNADTLGGCVVTVGETTGATGFHVTVCSSPDSQATLLTFPDVANVFRGGASQTTGLLPGDCFEMKYIDAANDLWLATTPVSIN